MAEPNLNESAWRRAVAGARHVYPSTEFEVGAALMTIIAGAIAAVMSADGSTTAQIAVPILGGAVGLLMTFVVVLAFELVAAPVRQRNELRAAWKTPPIKTVNIELTLRNAYRKGNDLAKRFERMTRFPPGSLEGAEAWADEVVELMAGTAPDEATRTFIEAGADESKIVARLRQRVDVLKEIVDGLG